MSTTQKRNPPSERNIGEINKNQVSKQVEYKEYICIRKCFFKNQPFEKGETVEFGSSVDIPEHFKRNSPEIKAALEEKEKSKEYIMSCVGHSKLTQKGC